MKARLLILIAALFSAVLAATGQEKSCITGTVVEEESAQPVIQAGIQLLSPTDSSVVAGTVTDAGGKFSIPAAGGSYIVKISYIGCKTLYRNADSGERDLGTLSMTKDVLFLKNAVVTAKATPVTIVEDTVVYNAAAYRVSEDATLEELLKKIPGLEITGGSQITLHGKEVKQLLVGGKRFFGGDVRTGLKNISADMVENIRAYERESDMARLTGVEDGEEEAVIDLTIKKEMMNKWRNRVSLGGGTSDRYLARANASNISKKKQITVIANSSNSNPAGISKSTSRNVLGSGSIGDSNVSDLGVNYANTTGRLSTEGSVQYTRTFRDGLAESRSETIRSTSMTYANGASSTEGLKNVLKSNLNFEWSLPKGFTVIFNPIFSFTDNNTVSSSMTSTYKKDPFTEVEGCDPFDWLALEYSDDPYKAIRVNTTSNNSETIVRTLNASASLQLSKRLSKPGRSASVRTTMGILSDKEWEGHDYTTRYFKIKNHPDSARLRKQYLETVNPTRNLSTQFTYNEPLTKKFSLQFAYNLTVKKNNNTKNFYSLQNGGFSDWTIPSGSSLDALKGSLPQGYESTYDETLSAKGNYTAYTHKINMSLRYITKKVIMTGGVNLCPQSTLLNYVGKDGTMEHTKTEVFNASPSITVRLKNSKHKQFLLTYRGTGIQNSMYNLMPVANGTQPTLIHYGNPYLKPSFVQTMRMNYSYSNMKKQDSFVTNLLYTTTANSVCNSTEYDADSGVRTVTPKNIDGNWKTSAALLYNKTLRDSRFSFSSHSSGEYLNSVAYLYNTKQKKDETNLTRRTMLRESADFSFRNDWLEVLLKAGGDWTDEKSLLRPDMNQTPYGFNIGSAIDFTFPWGMHLTGDYTVLAQRGYAYDSLNRDYHLLNARVTQSVLKGKGTIRLDGYDLLGQVTNLVRSFSAERRAITTYNGVNRYAMLRFVYKFQPKKKPTSRSSATGARETPRPQLPGLQPAM